MDATSDTNATQKLGDRINHVFLENFTTLHTISTIFSGKLSNPTVHTALVVIHREQTTYLFKRIMSNTSLIQSALLSNNYLFYRFINENVAIHFKTLNTREPANNCVATQNSKVITCEFDCQFQFRDQLFKCNLK